MISGGARSFSNMMNMSFGNRSSNASKRHLIESDDEGNSDDEDQLQQKSDETSDPERQRGRFSFGRKKRTDNIDSSEVLQFSPASSPKQTLIRAKSSNIAFVTKSPAQGAAQLVFVNKSSPKTEATSADTSKSPSRKTPARANTTGMMGMMFMGDMEGGDALLQMQCAASVAEPKAGKTKRQKNKDVLEAYNAKMAARKAAKKARKAAEETGKASTEGGKQRIKIRVRVPKGSDPAAIAAMAQKVADQQQEIERSRPPGHINEELDEESDSNQSGSRLHLEENENKEDDTRLSEPPTTPKTPSSRKLVTATFSNLSAKLKSPRTPRTPSRGSLRSPRTPRAPRTPSAEKEKVDAVSPTRRESPLRAVPLRAPSNESLKELQQCSPHQNKTIEGANSMSEIKYSPGNDQTSPKRKSKSPKSPESPKSSPKKSPTRKNLSRARSVRQMIAEREKEMKSSDDAEHAPHRSIQTTGSGSLRRQKSLRSRTMKSEDKTSPDSPVLPRRQKSMRSKSGRFTDGSTATQEDEKSLISSAQTVAVPSSASPRRLRREQSTSGRTENIVPESSSRQYPQSPKPRTRRLHTASLRRLATDERGHDSMKASASVASASIATVPVLTSSSTGITTTARCTALRKPFRDTPSRRRGTEVAPGTPRKRPQKTESVQSVQARIRQLNASAATLDLA